MSVPIGLDAWEIVAFSGLCAMSFLSCVSVIGVSFAYFVTREPAVAAETVRAAVPTPATTQPAVLSAA